MTFAFAHTDPQAFPRSEPMATIDLSEARDRELVLRIRGGDEEAFRGLFARYAPTAMALARRVVLKAHLAEEIVQEVFLALWKNPDAYDQRRGSVRSWLMAMVHHRAVDLVRREEAYRRRAEEQVAEARAMAPDPADQVAEEIDLPRERQAVRAALVDLPEEQRRVIELMYFDGLSQSRIAERLGLPLGTVKSRTLLGMRKLRAALAGGTR
jgi:RNA polymerase sigma-70 factor (ECF subfamily)